MYDAYHRVFERCGLTFRAGRGAVGRDRRRREPRVHGRRRGRRGRLRLVHELRLRRQRRGGAPAVARRRRAPPAPPTAPPLEKVHTPDLPGHRRRVEVPRRRRRPTLLKCIAFDVDGELGLALVPGDREVNEFALRRRVAPRRVRLFDRRRLRRASRAPEGLHRARLPRRGARGRRPVGRGAPIGWVTGANEVDHHVRNAVLGRDFDVDVWADLVDDRARRPVPALRRSRCRSTAASRSGTSSSSARSTPMALDAHYTDENGEQHPMVMGCYGIGVIARRRRGRRGAPRRARHRVAAGARAVRRAPRRACPAAATARPTVRRRGRPPLRRARRARASTCSTTTAT